MKALFTENGKPSGTKAILSVTGLTVVFRLLLADVPIGGKVIFPSLDWSGVALVLGAVGALYAGRRATEAWQAGKLTAKGGPDV